MRALGYPVAGARFVYRTHPGLARFWVPPVLVTGLLLTLVGYFAFELGAELTATLLAPPTGEGFLSSVGRFLYSAFEWMLALVLMAVGAVAVALLSSVIAAPFNDALSQEVERLQGGVEGPPLTLRHVIADVRRTVALELFKLVLYVAVMLPMFVLSLLVPGAGQVAYSAFGFGFSASYFCLDYLDWPAARRGWPARRRLRLLWKRPGVALGFGLGVWLLLLIPLVNLLFMPAAVAGGTLLFMDLHEESESEPTFCE